MWTCFMVDMLLCWMMQVICFDGFMIDDAGLGEVLAWPMMQAILIPLFLIIFFELMVVSPIATEC